MIAIKSSATSEAPPIKPPSTSGLEKISTALPGLTLPPYRMVTLFAIVASKASEIVLRINACIS